MKISNRSLQLQNSFLQEFFIKAGKIAKEKSDFISLGVGQPYNNVQEKVKEAEFEAIKNNLNKYSPSSGAEALKKVIAKKYGCSADKVVVSNGAKTILGAIIWTLVDSKDIVLIPSPYYPPFIQLVLHLWEKTPRLQAILLRWYNEGICKYIAKHHILCLI